MTRLRRACLALFALPLLALPAAAEDSFSKRLGAVKVGDVKPAPVYDLPFLTWGGDVATFIANGGDKETKKDTLFDKQGIKVNLVNGDDFLGQVKNYLEGKTPFLRGTLSQLGQASEALGQDPRTAPVVFLQLTWSAGDHMVARPTCKTLNDLKGKKIVLQEGGPHVGMLDDALKSAGLKWSDIKVVWAKNVTAVKGEPDKDPAAMFRKDPTIDACFVISPDMVDLTGGLEKTGDGSEKSVKGAKVLVSTVYLDHSIADVYACRKDFFDAHRDVVEKFAAGYLKATEELVAIKNEVKDKPTERYAAVLRLARQLFGKDLASDADADGLISDAVFVGLPGNYAFFKDKGNLSGFEVKQTAALDLALSLGDARVRREMLPADFDYARLKNLGDLTALVDAPRAARFADNPKEKNTIYSFHVYFEGGQSTFSEEKYRDVFQRAVEQASLFGNAIVSVKGHANPQDLTWGFRTVALERGLLTERQGKLFRKDGSEFAMDDMKQIIAMIDKENLGDVKVPMVGAAPMGMNDQLKMLKDLSNERAAAVRRAVVDYAARHGYRLDQSQMKSAGLGGTEPVLVFPRDYKEGGQNRRVEFRIIQVGVEAIAPEAFDY